MRVAALAITFLAAGAAADDVRFVVVDAGRVETLDRELRDHGRRGHHVVGSCRGVSADGKERFVVLLERAEPPEPVDYAAVALAGDVGAESLARLDELGGLGYRLLPSSVLTRSVGDWWLAPSAYERQVVSILERNDAAARHYEVVPYGDPEAFHERLDDLAARGFTLLGLVNASRRPRAILAAASDAEVAAPEGPYRVVLSSTRRGLRRALAKLRRDGYEVLDVAQASILAPPIVVVEETSRLADDVRYKMMRKPAAKERRDKLEPKLNARGRNGFRVVPQSVGEGAILLVRDAGRTSHWEYRTLSSLEPPGLPRALDEAVREGHRVVAMFHDAGETIVLVGRPADSASKRGHQVLDGEDEAGVARRGPLPRKTGGKQQLTRVRRSFGEIRRSAWLTCRRSVERQVDPEARPAGLTRLVCDAAPVGGDQLLGNREADTGAVRFGCLEQLEDLQAGGNPVAAVLYRDSNRPPVGNAGREHDLAGAFANRFDRVFDEVVEHAPDRGLVGAQ